MGAWDFITGNRQRFNDKFLGGEDISDKLNRYNLYKQVNSGLESFMKHDLRPDAGLPAHLDAPSISPANLAELGAYAAPGIGESADALEMYQGLEEGDYTKAGLAGLGLALPMVSGAWLVNQMGKVGDMAGLGATGIGKSQRGIIGGVNAKTADLDALEQAKALKAKGAGDEAIHAETGWWLSHPDGKPRFEIDDSGASMLPLDQNHAAHRLRNVIDHDGLRSAYPDTDSIFFSESKAGNSSYVQGEDHIRINKTEGINTPKINRYNSLESDLIAEARRLDGAGLLTPGAESDIEKRIGALAARAKRETGRDSRRAFDKESSLHELQHAIQQREGFAKGGNPLDDSLPTISDIGQEINAKFRERASAVTSSPEYARFVDDYIESTPREAWPISRVTGEPKKELLRGRAENEAYKLFGLDAIEDAREAEIKKLYTDSEAVIGNMANTMYPRAEGYRRLAGEAEARLVQSRMNMTPDERAARPFWLDYDVPIEDQIVRYE